MSNSRSKKQCKLKREIDACEIEIKTDPLTLLNKRDDQLFNKLSSEFWAGSLRHGNNRKYYAKRKVDLRKSERMKQKEEDRKELK